MCSALRRRAVVEVRAARKPTSKADAVASIESSFLNRGIEKMLPPWIEHPQAACGSECGHPAGTQPVNPMRSPAFLAALTDHRSTNDHFDFVGDCAGVLAFGCKPSRSALAGATWMPRSLCRRATFCRTLCRPGRAWPVVRKLPNIEAARRTAEKIQVIDHLSSLRNRTKKI